MSHNVILGWFCKSGQFHHLSRKLHNLPRPALEKALEMIAEGIDPRKAISKAKRAKTA